MGHLECLCSCISVFCNPVKRPADSDILATWIWFTVEENVHWLGQSWHKSLVNYPPIVSLCTSNGNIGTTSKFCSVFWCFLWQKISKIDIVLAHQPRRKKQCSFCFRFSSSWMIPPFPAFTDALNYVIIHVASSRGGLGDWNFNHSCLLQRHFLGLFARCLLFHICVVGGEDEPFQASLPFERHDQ